MAVILGIGPVDAGTISAEDVAAVLRLLHRDLGYADAAALVDHVSSSALGEDFGSDAPQQIVAAMNAMQIALGTASSDIVTDGNDDTALFGRVGDDVLSGGGGADWLFGQQGNDVLRGDFGSDIYTYMRGDGHDAITEDGDAGNNDRLVLHGIDPADVSLLRDGNHVTLVIVESAPGAGDGGSILLKTNLVEFFHQGIDQIAFDDGTIWDRAFLRSRLVAEAPTPGDDVIVGFGTANTIVGGLGDDPGAGNGGSILLKTNLVESFHQGIDQIAFDDGTVWDRALLRTRLMAEASTSGNDVIVGFGTADTIIGGLGDDQLNGDGSSDTYIYARGDGNDTITEDAGDGTNDQLVLEGIGHTDVSLLRNGNDVTLVAESSPGVGNGGSILLMTNLNENYGQGIDRIVFADGSFWTRADLREMLISFAGTPGNDTIVGSNSADIISGGLGNDNLQGKWNNDIYVYARGDGNDTITEDPGYGDSNQLVLRGIVPTDVSLLRNAGDATLVIAESAPGAGDGGSILLKNNLHESSGRGIDQIAFDDGTVWGRADLRLMLLAQASTPRQRRDRRLQHGRHDHRRPGQRPVGRLQCQRHLRLCARRRPRHHHRGGWLRHRRQAGTAGHRIRARSRCCETATTSRFSWSSRHPGQATVAPFCSQLRCCIPRAAVASTSSLSMMVPSGLPRYLPAISSPAQAATTS